MKNMKWAALAAIGFFAFACGGEDKVDPPVINSVSASATTVDETVGTATLTAEVTGESVTYLWSATSGTFDDETLASPTWTADTVSTTSHTPATETATITLTLTNEGGEATDTVDITVTNLNEVPVIDTPAAADVATTLPGTDVNLTVAASDPENDSLSYSWIQLLPATPQGTFTNENTDAATWTAPAVATDTDFEFEVTITDTETGEEVDTATTMITVPSWANDIFPIFDATNFGNNTGCDSCHAGGAGTFTWDMTDAGTAYTSIVGVGATGNCAGLDYIDATGDLANSGIFQKISNGAGTCGGNQMPNGDNTFFNNNPGLRTTIESWIIAGAQNN